VNPATLAEDYARAVAELKAALAGNPGTRLEQAGCIQYFEFCFELAWKVLKTLAVHQGMSGVDSPRAALRAAFGQGWIDEEIVWLEMLEARNRMSHTYNAEAALAVFARLATFLDGLVGLDDKLRTILPTL
jgi:nucleotidyltransferase substrate binding protein (TIGR01987 family)